MKSAVASASFTGVDFTDALTSAITAVALPKKTASALKKAMTASLTEKVKNQPKPVKLSKKTAYTQALETYKGLLKEIRGGSVRGRPFTEQVEQALNRMTSNELHALELGRSHRFRKEAPASLVISTSENVAGLRA